MKLLSNIDQLIELTAIDFNFKKKNISRDTVIEAAHSTALWRPCKASL